MPVRYDSVHAQSGHNVSLTCQGSGQFNFYRSATAGGPYTRLNASPLATCSFVDATGAGGTQYFYVATSTDGVVESIFSNEVSATFLARPLPPTGLVAVTN